MNKIKSWCRNSLTIAWSYFLAVLSALLLLAPTLLDLVAIPEVTLLVHSVLPPQWLASYTASIALVTYLARMRSLKAS